MSDVSLDLLQTMIQRVLDGQTVMRRDVQNIRQRLARIERTMRSVQQRDLDESEIDDELQAELDALKRRVDALEAAP